MKKPAATLYETMSARFGATVQEFRGEESYILPAENLVPAVTAMRDTHGFDMLIDITAVDYWPEDIPRFHVVYHFLDVTNNEVICVRIPVNGQAGNLDSISGLFPNATWYEREVWDMFGLRFNGNPDMRRIVMPYDWQGHPLRKDYPLGYEEVQYSFNFSEIDLRKPYASE